MARPLRIQYPGAFYHIMNRGNDKRNIFLADGDRKTFLDALSNSCDIFDVRPIVYVLMPTYFHLIVQTQKANLSEFMRHFLVTYTVRFNRKRGRTGHVFQGRYKSLLLDKETYLLPVSRHIHISPVRKKILKPSEMKTRTALLKNYPWSSLGGYRSAKNRVEWLDYSWLLETYYGGDTVKGRRNYWSYVCRGLRGDVENPFEKVFLQSILGSDAFITWVKKKVFRGKEREIPALRKLREAVPIENILAEVATCFAKDPADILNRHTKAKLARQLAMELCYRYGEIKQKDIGKIFGVDYSTVSQNRSRLKRKLEEDKKRRRQFDEIEKRICTLSNQNI